MFSADAVWGCSHIPSEEAGHVPAVAWCFLRALEQILLRGRRQSLPTARLYMQDGLANLATIRCSTAANEKADLF